MHPERAHGGGGAVGDGVEVLRRDAAQVPQVHAPVVRQVLLGVAVPAEDGDYVPPVGEPRAELLDVVLDPAERRRRPALADHRDVQRTTPREAYDAPHAGGRRAHRGVENHRIDDTRRVVAVREIRSRRLP
jgi:hypothetical protein